MTDLLDRLKALGEKATPGPLRRGGNVITDSRDIVAMKEPTKIRHAVARMSDCAELEANADLYVLLVNAAPLLVDVAEAARIVNESYVPAIQQPTDDEWAALDSALAALNAEPEEAPNG